MWNVAGDQHKRESLCESKANSRRKIAPSSKVSKAEVYLAKGDLYERRMRSSKGLR